MLLFNSISMDSNLKHDHSTTSTLCIINVVFRVKATQNGDRSIVVKVKMQISIAWTKFLLLEKEGVV